MKKRILIIDDDAQLNKINEKVLNSSGLVAELHFARNGYQGIEYLLTRIEKNYPLPEVIVLDLHMPEMSGLDFLEYFQNMKFHGKTNIELVVFTASSSLKDREHAMARGITHFISKPYLLRGLTDIISRPACHQSINK